ncbi:hypothetical protein M1834_003510 [Neofusicoccum parvum]|nr:hypothetical protein M1834_003510 [Neofusicoccum parvum]
MVVKYTILFPKGSIYDMDHYTKIHMPMIAAAFPVDFLRWEVATFPAEASFMAVCHVEWTSAEAFESMSQPGSEAGKKIFADVPNFSTEAPIFMMEKYVAGGP